MKSWMWAACVAGLMIGHMEYSYSRSLGGVQQEIEEEVQKMALNGLTEEERRKVAEAWVMRDKN